MVKLSSRWDCIIIGGGIVGCSTAYYLSKAGLKPLIIEKNYIAGAQSGRSLGFVRQQGRDFRELPLMIEGNRLWRTLEAELGRSVGWARGGNLATARSGEQLAGLEAWVRQASSYDIDVRLVNHKEITDLTSNMKHDYIGGMYTPSDGKADPAKATTAYYTAACELGARSVLGHGVDEILLAGGKVRGVRVGSQIYSSNVVIAAAGGQTSRILAGIGIVLPQDCIRTTVCRTQPVNLSIMPGIWAVDIGIRQGNDGSVHVADNSSDYDMRWNSPKSLRWFSPLLKKNRDLTRLNFLSLFGLGKGASAAVLDTPQPRAAPGPNMHRANIALELLFQHFPALRGTQLQSCWAGVIDYTPDAVPAIGPVPNIEGLLVGTGFSGHGLGLGPISGKALAEIVAKGSTDYPINPFAVDRFARGEWEPPANTL